MEQCVSLCVHIMVKVRNVFVKTWKAAVIPFMLIYLQKMLLLGAQKKTETTPHWLGWC